MFFGAQSTTPTSSPPHIYDPSKQIEASSSKVTHKQWTVSHPSVFQKQIPASSQTDTDQSKNLSSAQENELSNMFSELIFTDIPDSTNGKLLKPIALYAGEPIGSIKRVADPSEPSSSTQPEGQEPTYEVFNPQQTGRTASAFKRYSSDSFIPIPPLGVDEASALSHSPQPTCGTQFEGTPDKHQTSCDQSIFKESYPYVRQLSLPERIFKSKTPDTRPNLTSDQPEGASGGTFLSSRRLFETPEINRIENRQSLFTSHSIYKRQLSAPEKSLQVHFEEHTVGNEWRNRSTRKRKRTGMLEYTQKKADSFSMRLHPKGQQHDSSAMEIESRFYELARQATSPQQYHSLPSDLKLCEEGHEKTDKPKLT